MPRLPPAPIHLDISKTALLDAFQRMAADDVAELPLRGVEVERLQPWHTFQEAQ